MTLSDSLFITYQPIDRHATHRTAVSSPELQPPVLQERCYAPGCRINDITSSSEVTRTCALQEWCYTPEEPSSKDSGTTLRIYLI